MQTETTAANERPPQLLNRDEAARFLRLSPGTLANWQSTQRMKIPCLKLGRKIFYRERDLAKWIESRAMNLQEG